MRIKSIRPTNKFAHIKFREIIDSPIDRRVLTPSGFQPVLACQYIKRGSTLRITTKFGELVCDPQHRLQVISQSTITEKFAKDLLQTDLLVGYHNEAVPCTITFGPVASLYDVQLPSPHWWYTSGVVSHNSIVLCNTAISSLQGMGGDGKPGQNVLLITFELDTVKTAMRCLGVASGTKLHDIANHKDYITRLIRQMQNTYQKRFAIFEWSPEECSVANIYALLDHLRKVESFRPDVIVIDYLDLMISRNDRYNSDDYTRQKHVSNEIRGLARNENVLVFTATQTNRTATTGEVVDLNKAAESFAKQFALDYVVSLNQTNSERKASPPRIRLYIAKNRNGPRAESIQCTIDYDTMVVKEAL